jgi:hypothetical protein
LDAIPAPIAAAPIPTVLMNSRLLLFSMQNLLFVNIDVMAPLSKKSELF